jgi:hypothetical protein
MGATPFLGNGIEGASLLSRHLLGLDEAPLAELPQDPEQDPVAELVVVAAGVNGALELCWPPGALRQLVQHDRVPPARDGAQDGPDPRPGALIVAA